MLLEREGKLRLDDPITTYLPDYPTHDRTITITHLLNHTSGIKSYTSLDNFMSDISQKNLAPADLLAYFKDLPPVFEPGTRFLYNNSGYHLLGLIIEKITGMSYEQFIQQHIFQPLGMRHSYYMHNETIIPRRASGYTKTPEGYRQSEYLNMMIAYAAGALGSTVEDLIRWDAALREERLLMPPHKNACIRRYNWLMAGRRNTASASVSPAMKAIGSSDMEEASLASTHLWRVF